MQALGLNGEDYNDSSPPITGLQISSGLMNEALNLVPGDAAER